MDKRIERITDSLIGERKHMDLHEKSIARSIKSRDKKPFNRIDKIPNYQVTVQPIDAITRSPNCQVTVQPIDTAD